MALRLNKDVTVTVAVFSGLPATIFKDRNEQNTLAAVSVSLEVLCEYQQQLVREKSHRANLVNDPSRRLSLAKR